MKIYIEREKETFATVFEVDDPNSFSEGLLAFPATIIRTSIQMVKRIIP